MEEVGHPHKITDRQPHLKVKIDGSMTAES
jgi:hypothetical protein